MTVYALTKRRIHLLQAYSVIVGGLFVPLLFVPFLLRELIVGIELPNPAGTFGILGLTIVVGVVAVAMGWRRLNLLPYEIYLYDSGIVEFKRRLDSVALHASDIHTLIKKQKEGDGEEGHIVVRELRIQHPFGSDIILRDFTWLDEFVAHLLALNPAIVVEGAWTT